MRHQEFDPPETLRGSIKCFWHNSRKGGDQLSAFEVQPDGYAEIIFYFGSLFRVSNDSILEPLPSPFIMGLLNQPAIFYTKHHLEIIGIRCYPWTVFDMLGLPPVKSGVQTLEHPITRLQTILNELILNGKISEVLIRIEQYFLDKHTGIPDDHMLIKAGAAMREANGSIPVSHVAAAAHTTVRTLERNFKQSSGHTVKDVSALIRFERARNQLWHNPAINLAGLAHELGYTDQSHLSREFKRYSGASPAAFARKAKKNRQVIGDDFVVFIQS